MLHVTNGDSAREAIEAAGLADRALAWQDVLHEGPVPAAGDLADIRADFLERMGWGDHEELRARFELRDASVAAADEVCLWFEADLHDQLQLVQALATLPGETEAYLVEAETLALPDLYPLFATRRRVTAEMRAAAGEAWEAFRSSDPRRLEALAASPRPGLPHLAAALRRLLEELPGTRDGLARSERQLLEVIDGGARRFPDVFAAQAALEERPFLGDTVVRARLADLGPLVARGRGLSRAGRDVLAGRRDWLDVRGGIDRWLGGVHLVGPDRVWRYDRDRGRLVPPA